MSVHPPVEGDDDNSFESGVKGVSNFNNKIGVSGIATGHNGAGVRGQGPLYGVDGFSVGNNDPKTISAGVHGQSSKGIGVEGVSDSFMGVSGVSKTSTGVYAETGSKNSIAIVGVNTGGGLAGLFDRNIRVLGTINKSALAFQIDHPLDPANKYLSHSGVESPEMKNLYDGVVKLDDKGEAKVDLPDWFGALNKDFRYHLTAIGAPGPNLYIAEEITEIETNYNRNNSHFKIAGGNPRMQVSWQVTGVRKDPYAKAHPIQVEEVKSDIERGYYIHPDLYDQDVDKGISHLAFSTYKK